jgi:probable rRNA maturation factor
MEFDLGILICSDIEIRKLNQQYRQIDAPTDVLSFGSDELNPETGVHYLGDLIVSFDKARTQALSANHDEMTEITILLIHGLLHLLGFDHDTTEKKKEMWKKQYQAHELLHIKIDSLPGEYD